MNRKVISLDEYRNNKEFREYKMRKHLVKLTPEQMKSTQEKKKQEKMIRESVDFKRISWER